MIYSRGMLFCNIDEVCVVNVDVEMKICIIYGVRGRKYRCMFKGSENFKVCFLILEFVLVWGSLDRWIEGRERRMLEGILS